MAPASSAHGMLRVFYVSQDHLSHARAARDYAQIIASRHEMVDDPARADVAVLHVEPHAVASVLQQHPTLLRCYRIGYFCWEASRLPAAYVPVMRLVDEVWTPSQYCVDVFAEHHGRVRKVPHVAERVAATAADTVAVRGALGHDPGQITLLVVSKPQDPRKNTAQVLRVFPRLRARFPNARLVVKNTRPDAAEHALASPGVTFVDQGIPEGEMTALFELANVLVSAHHGEGWAFNVSDAMALGVPVVATAYSGNLEFMNGDTAFALPAREETIRPEDRFGLFDFTMKWGYVGDEDLLATLASACEAVASGRAGERASRARAAVGAFSLPNVAAITLGQLADVAGRLAAGAR